MVAPATGGSFVPFSDQYRLCDRDKGVMVAVDAGAQLAVGNYSNVCLEGVRHRDKRRMRISCITGTVFCVGSVKSRSGSSLPLAHAMGDG